MAAPAKLTDRPASFHGAPPTEYNHRLLHRPKSNPDLQRFRSSLSNLGCGGKLADRQPQKLLLNVTVQGSLGAVHVMISPECSVEELVKAALEVYVKEGRRPTLAGNEPQAFELHYSSYSFESLNEKEKLITLGSRNFFLCPKRQNGNTACSNETKGSKNTRSSSWLSFMGFQ